MILKNKPRYGFTLDLKNRYPLKTESGLLISGKLKITDNESNKKYSIEITERLIENE